MRNEVPQTLRNRVAAVVVDLSDDMVKSVFTIVAESLGLDPDLRTRYAFNARSGLRGVLNRGGDSPVAEFCQSVEAITRAILRAGRFEGGGQHRAISDIEQAFLLDRFGFRIVDGLVVAAGSEPENAAVDEARDLLAGDSRFKYADDRFVSALVKATRGEGPDLAEAVHSAVSSVEEVCRRILHDQSVKLDTAIEKLRTKLELHAQVAQSIKNLYGFRGDLAGAAHGAGETTEHQARFVIHTAAAGMVLIVSEARDRGLL